MAKQKTDKCRLKSHYSDSWISENQFLVEKICTKKAQIEKKYLPAFFWKIKEWNVFFRRQTPLAAHLLKVYPLTVILESLDDKRCNKLLSLGGMYILEPILKEKMKINTQRNKSLKETVKSSTSEKPRQPTGKQSLLSQLN